MIQCKTNLHQSPLPIRTTIKNRAESEKTLVNLQKYSRIHFPESCYFSFLPPCKEENPVLFPDNIFLIKRNQFSNTWEPIVENWKYLDQS